MKYSPILHFENVSCETLEGERIMRRLTDEDLKKIDAITHGFKNRPEALDDVRTALEELEAAE